MNGKGATLVVVASATVLIALFPCGWGHRIRHEGRERRWGGPEPVGADFEANHPPYCPINGVLNDGSLRSCRSDDPWRLVLRDALAP